MLLEDVKKGTLDFGGWLLCAVPSCTFHSPFSYMRFSSCPARRASASLSDRNIDEEGKCYRGALMGKGLFLLLVSSGGPQ